MCEDVKIGTTATVQPDDPEIWKAMNMEKSLVCLDCLYLNSLLTEIHE
jgi:hypothetical protein